MEQLLIHLFADYWLQNDWMATNKKENFLIALLHSIIYTIPFLLLTHSVLALVVIGLTHSLIDGTHIVEKLNQIKNLDFDIHILANSNYEFNDGYGYRPDFIRVWLIIIQDNILHLIINYLCIKYL